MRTRSDGKVDAGCPQCGAMYRVSADQLDQKVECTECHRVFFPKTTAGKRVKPPDNTKVYVGFGIGGVVLIGLFVLMSRGGDVPKPKPEEVPVVKAPAFSRGSHPRALMLVQWAQGLQKDDRMSVPRYTDFGAVAKLLDLEATADADTVMKALQTHKATRFLRELNCESAELASNEDMESATGKAMVFVLPKPGDDNYDKRWRGEIEVTFRAEGDVVRVTGWEVKVAPIRLKADPDLATFKPNKDIARAKEVEISDSAGTRKVMESQPAPVPHWEKSTPELQKLADEVVADVLKSADPESPGALLTRATLRVKTDDERKAVVPRLLNAMYENYGDVVANNLKLSQLNRAMIAVIGFAVNYQVEDSGNPAKDKAERESCIRQWFAFWYRNSNDFSKWVDNRDDLDAPIEEPKKKKL